MRDAFSDELNLFYIDLPLFFFILSSTTMSLSKNYAEDINAGWNWIVTGGSALAARTTARQPNWALGSDPAGRVSFIAWVLFLLLW